MPIINRVALFFGFLQHFHPMHLLLEDLAWLFLDWCVFWTKQDPSGKVSIKYNIVGNFDIIFLKLQCCNVTIITSLLATLAKLIIFASFFLVCCMIALALAGISIVGWDHVPMYLLCKDFGTMKAEVLQDYNGMSDQGFGK